MHTEEQSAPTRSDPTPLAGVIWDIDGTLCDTLPLVVATFRTIFARHLGQTLSDEEIVADFGPTEGGTIRKRIPRGWQSIEREYVAEYARTFNGTRPFPGIPALLAALRDRGVRQAVVTGKGAVTARLTLDRLGLAEYFDRIETGSPDANIKSACFRMVLAGWPDLAAAQVACVGDTPSDARNAHAAGAIAVRAGWSKAPGSKADQPDEADERFETPDAMLAWALERLEGVSR